ncbi:asparagine synthase-related protein, partial [Rhodococcus qingshengii]|uniref:asparagine synthase-related protein n=1 Tax=Rhodococcus qingshengii TaxID=334542 RepID=UPI001BE55BDB
MHHPLSNSSCWSDVYGLDPSDYLAVKDQSRPRSVPWWSAPHSDNDLQTGAEKTAASIFESISGSLSGHKTVSCDISGGVDSCSVAAVAHHLGHSPDEDPIAIHGFTSISQDEFNSDRLWAQDFSDSIGFDSHTFSRWDEMPRDYDGLDEMAAFALDEPSIAAIGHRRFTFLTDLAAKKGSSLHFTGYGGDQTFIGTPTHSADALRTDPLWAISQIMTYRAMSRWDLRSCIQQLVSRREYGTWLARNALTSNRDRHEPLLTWGVPAQIPAWFDRNTVRQMTERVDDAARTAQPLADLPGRHLEIDLIRQCTRMVRAIADIVAQKSGVLIVAPLIEENVVESALSVRVQERVTPYEYKPVLTSALGWLLPPKIQGRQTKGGEDTDAALGFSGNIESIRRTWDESRVDGEHEDHGDYRRDGPEDEVGEASGDLSQGCGVGGGAGEEVAGPECVEVSYGKSEDVSRICHSGV